MAAPRRVRQGDRRFLLRGMGTTRRIDRENAKAGARQADRKDHRRPEAGLCIGDLAEGNGAGHSLSPFPSVRLRAPPPSGPKGRCTDREPVWPVPRPIRQRFHGISDGAPSPVLPCADRNEPARIPPSRPGGLAKKLPSETRRLAVRLPKSPWPVVVSALPAGHV